MESIPWDVSVITSKRYVIYRRGHRIRGWGNIATTNNPTFWYKSHFYRFCLCLSSTHQIWKSLTSLDFPHTLPSQGMAFYHTTFARLSRWISPSMCLWRSPACHGRVEETTAPGPPKSPGGPAMSWHYRNVRPGIQLLGWLPWIDICHISPLAFCGWTQRL